MQHIALYTDDIFHTLEEMRKIADSGVGFTFMNPPPQGYYERVRDRLGGDTDLTNEQIAMAEKLGVLIDRDDQGILLQIFTKPVGDRPTVFLEIIQVRGCTSGLSVCGNSRYFLLYKFFVAFGLS